MKPSDSGSVTKPDGSVLRAAGAMGLATFFSRILGLVREQVFAVMFGAGNATDAFNIAFRIPNLLRDLFAEGAMSAAFVPTFTRVRLEEGERRAWRVAGLVFRVLFFSVACLALLGMYFAQPLVELYAARFHEVPGKFELTVNMTRIMFPYFPLVALSAAFMGILNACGRFFLPAFSSALFNLASIVTGVLLATIMPHFGRQPIEGMAFGVLIGGTIQALSQLPSLRRVGYRYPPRHDSDPVWRRDPALRQMLFLMVPGTVGLAATQVNILVNSVLATSQGPGAVSWLNYAFRLLQFPIGIFGVSMAVATLPRVSKLWVEKSFQEASDTVDRSLRQVFALNLPAAGGLAFLGVPIIQMLFEYGRFSTFDSHSTAMALAAYSLGLGAYSAVKVLVPACYAVGNARTPVVASLLAVAATVVLNLSFVHSLGFVGLALGTSLGAWINAVYLLAAFRRIVRKAGGELHLASLAKSFFLNSLVALGMGAGCWALHEYVLLRVILQPETAGWTGHAAVALIRAFRVGLDVLVGIGLVLVLAKIFRVPETGEVLELFTLRLKKKLSRRSN